MKTILSIKEYLIERISSIQLDLKISRGKVAGQSCLYTALACFLIVQFSVPNAYALSVYGKQLSKAYSDDFFQFFRFRVVGVSITKDGFMEIIFKPPKRNPSRTSVKLKVVLTKEGAIKRMDLGLARSFINDSKQGMFARDVAKSFIQAGVHKDDYDKVRPLVNEIFFRQKLTPIVIGESKSSKSSAAIKGISIFKLGEGKLTSGDIIIIGDGGSIPKLPEELSTPYKCFIGKITSTKVNLSKTTVLFDNAKVDGHKELHITIGASDSELSRMNSSLDFHSLPMYVP